MSNDLQSLEEIIGLCGSFLTIREDTVYFMHQSAKDYLLENKNTFKKVFPSGRGERHHKIFSSSLQVLSRTLRRDIYNLRTLGYPIEQVKRPDLDLLVALCYSYIYQVDYLSNQYSDSNINPKVDLQDRGIVDVFIRRKYLYLLEALSLYRRILEGVLLKARLAALIQVILKLVVLSIYTIY